jgi:hypothetical protein
MRIVIVADAETYARDFPDDPVEAVKQLVGRNTDKVYFSLSNSLPTMPF